MSRLIVMIMLALAAAACGVSDPADRVAEASDALERGDNDRAQAYADAIVSDSTVFATLEAGQLCRLARVLVRLSSGTDNESNDASAARCLARARTLQSDTVTAFLYSLPGEDAGRLMVLDRVGTYMEIPRDSLVSAEDLQPDSAAAEEGVAE